MKLIYFQKQFLKEDYRENSFERYREEMKVIKRTVAASFLAVFPVCALIPLALISYSLANVISVILGREAFGLDISADNISLIPFFLFIIAAVFSLLGFIFREIKAHKVIFAAFIGLSAYGAVSLVAGWSGIGIGFAILLYGILGVIIENSAVEGYERMKELSEIQGYPEFLDLLEAARPVANTMGVRYDKYKEIVERRKTKAEALKNGVLYEEEKDEDLMEELFPEIDELELFEADNPYINETYDAKIKAKYDTRRYGEYAEKADEIDQISAIDIIYE